MIALSVAVTFFVWFVGSCIMAARKHRQPRFVLLFLCGGFVLASGIAFLGCAGMIPPPHLPKPHVTVGYTEQRISPDGASAYFIKRVSQESTTMVPESTGFRLIAVPTYEEKSYPIWSEFFLCRSDAKGQNPRALFELPWQKFVAPGNVRFEGPTVWWPVITQFDVSWTQSKAVVFVNRPKENTHFVDLNSGSIETHSIGDPTRGGHSGYNPFPLQLIEHESKVLWSDGWVGIIDFEGNEKSTTILTNRSCWPTPYWNEQQGAFVFLVNPSEANTNSEFWAFNTNLEFLERADATSLSRLWRRNRWRGQRTDDKYAWVIEQQNSPRPKPIEFALKNHTIEHQRIDPKDAAGIW